MNIHITELMMTNAIALIKVLVVVGAMMGAVPLMVLWERKLLGYIQQRLGPMEAGPWGILQTIADAAKLFLKENTRPDKVDGFLHTMGPMMAIIPAIFVLCVVPLGPVFTIDFQNTALSLPGGLNITVADHVQRVGVGITDLNIGLLFYLAVGSIGVYGIVLAGYSSNSKYSLLGAIRASAQMLSYEIAIGLSLIGVLLIGGTFELRPYIEQQAGGFWRWHVWSQPIGFLIFLTAGFAETNRLPFDLAEGESELGGGFHTEYSSMKWALFFQAEYMNMFTFSGIICTLFLGGWRPPFEWMMLGEPGTVLYALCGVAWFVLKFLAFLSLFIWVRGTIPRFRYDQLMDFGWKIMFPAALVNMFVTAAIMIFAGDRPADINAHPISGWMILVLFIAGAGQVLGWDWRLNAMKRRLLDYAR